jgi:hypothetical protein
MCVRRIMTSKNDDAPVQDKEMERLYHLVLSEDELAVLVLGLIAVNGVIYHRLEESYKDLIIEYMRVKLSTGLDLRGGMNRLGDKLNAFADNMETNKEKG